MKFNLYKKFAVLIVGLTVSAGTAYADVKIKSRQTTSGQTMENTVLIKGKRQRTEMMNGAMISIMQCDLRRDLQIMPQTKTYQVSLFDTVNAATNNQTVDVKSTPVTKGGTVTTTVTSKDTGERKQMFGYTAKHIITTMETDSSPDACNLTKSKMQFDGWYIDAEFALECAQNRYSNYQKPVTGGCQDKTEFKTVGTAKRGYPVLEKMTLFDENGKATMTMETEVVELSKATLDAALFDIPAGYTEAKDVASMYAAMANNAMKSGNDSVEMPNDANNSSQNSGMSQNIKNLAQNKSNTSAEVSQKKEGTVRIGMANVKTSAVGEGINPQELAGAIQSTLGEYLKGSKVELVSLETKLASAIESEAKEKQCDFVLYATVSHKKGGGGFGMFKAIAPVLSNVVPMAGAAGGMAGAVAGSVASSAIYTASGATANVKPKDELTLDVKLQNGTTVALTKQYKGKAKSGGEDIISPMIEQLAQAIIDTVAK